MSWVSKKEEQNHFLLTWISIDLLQVFVFVSTSNLNS